MSTNKIFISKEAQEELGLKNNFITETKKEKVDPETKKQNKIDAKERKKQKKRLQKLREKKAKEKKLSEILSTLEKNAVKNEEVLDLMTSASTMKKDQKKYQLVKHKLNLPDTPEEVKMKEKEKLRVKKRQEKIKEDEEASRVRLLSQSDDDDAIPVMKVEKQDLLPTDVVEEKPEPKPMVIDHLKELNKLLAELDSDDEESLADKNANKNLMKVNLLDEKPDIIPIQRTEEMDEMRKELPVFMHEREVLESVENNLVTIVCGETGSGKSTQIPQFLYEYGYTATSRKGMIGITQPRRVAATSLSQRIADELNVKHGDKVGYQIRYDKKNISQNTVIKLMTDGILLKEIELDFLLEKYSVVIIDEAHERSINTDILISLLSRIVRLRLKKVIKERKKFPCAEEYHHFPLRVVIMSATLRVDDFIKNKRLFPSLVPRMIKVDSRQYPVEIHFNKVTREDYEEETFKKVCKIHKNLPKGGILVFLTGRKEIQYMVERLKAEFKKKTSTKKSEKSVEENKNQEQKVEEADEDMDDDIMPVQVLPLYSMLSPNEQLRVFQPPKEGHRFIVVSTNIAETSVTIPNIRYVVDCGREKQKVYDPQLRLSKFLISWTSQASANQRAGRAGRTGPGHCYRLYSSAVYNKMEKFAVPEILRTPIDQTILQLKALGIYDLCKFPFVSSPNLAQVKSTLRELCVLNALELKDKSKDIEDEFKQDLIKDQHEKLINDDGKILSMSFNRDKTRITDLGLLLSTIPLAPKFAKMLVFGRKAKILELAIITVASLTVQEIFRAPNIKLDFSDDDVSDDMEEISDDPDLVTQIDIERRENKLLQKKQKLLDKRKLVRKEMLTQKFKIKEKWFSERGDLHTNVLAVGVFLQYFGKIRDQLKQGKITKKEMGAEMFKFAKSLYLNKKSVDEIINLSQQLQKIMNDLNPDLKVDVFSLKPPSGKQQTLLQQLILVGFPENIAKKKEVFNSNGVDINLTRKKPVYECLFSGQEVYLNNESNLDNPKFICYKEIQQVNVRKKHEDDEETTKNYIRGCTRIDTPHWIFNLCGQSLINSCDYLKRVQPIYQKAQSGEKVNYKELKKIKL
ncbi:unnamed protein product [Moneuplotes crassus]|uniref:RNA helicase n=2 Tax=Euplotes crassus TaxID=5936 RepID=A0AAD1UR79_EUPCR|nr:unnamed protein product [Moneuplotes crassus]